ncbi:MAG: tetratricopeptide repeat protein [Phycisphaerales bacterium]|nr:tetratricopeptide repeat protein [Phycisphaerales bacterium]
MPAPSPQLAAKLSQVRSLLERGLHSQARPLVQRLAQQHPAEPAVAALASLTHYHLAELPQAIYHAQRLVSLSPDSAEAHTTLAGLLIAERRTDEALASLRAAASVAPGDPSIPFQAAQALADAGRYGASLAQTEAALALGPPTPPLLSLRATCLLNLGRVEESVAQYAAALRLDPTSSDIASQLALALNYAPAAPPHEVRDAHRTFARLLGSASPPPLTPAPRTSGRPRVGIISPDLRTHSVAFFLLPWLRHRDRGAMDLYAYYTNRHADSLTAVIRPLCTQWRDMGNRSDDSVARSIAADSLDLLIDLSGHTAGHSLGVLARRPARLQATYLGYPNTTGLEQVDVRFVDSITDPPGESNTLCVESLVRLDPCFLCFEPPAGSPPVSPASRPGGRVTFGSFNAAAKINDQLLALWARLLSRVPGSTLLLKAVHYAEPEDRDMLRARFARAGGDPASLEVSPPTRSQSEHLGLYSRVDVALDPFPYHGTTTTLEALWMGVPVVTLAGRVHASRVGASLLSAAGLSGLVTTDPDSYVSVASSLASDAPRLHSLRESLRPALASGPLCDGPAFAARFDAALIQIMRRVGRSGTTS